MRGNEALAAWGREALARAEAAFVGSAHIREVLEEVVGHVDRVHEVPPGVDVEEFVRGRARRRSPACSRRRAGSAEPRQRERAAARRGQCRAAGRVPRGRRADRRLLREADREQGRPRPARRAPRPRRARRDRRLRRLPRDARGAAGPRTLFTGPLEHRHLVHLLPLADAAVVPSIFPEAFGMVAAEAAASGCPPLVARHPAWPRSPPGSSRSTRSTCATSPRSRAATSTTCARS